MRKRTFQKIALIILTNLMLIWKFKRPTKDVIVRPQNVTEMLCSLKGYPMEGLEKTLQVRSEEYYEIKTAQSFGAACGRMISLNQFGQSDVVTKQMFFLETSGRSKLSPRQACSVESAARFSNLQVHVILLSDSLDLTDNSTCYLYQTVQNVEFYTVNWDNIFKDTPIHNLTQSKKFHESQFKVSHFSDALRMAMVYKYGGFYSDLDAVTIQDLSRFHNVIGMELPATVGSHGTGCRRIYRNTLDRNRSNAHDASSEGSVQDRYHGRCQI